MLAAPEPASLFTSSGVKTFAVIYVFFRISLFHRLCFSSWAKEERDPFLLNFHFSLLAEISAVFYSEQQHPKPHDFIASGAKGWVADVPRSGECCEQQLIALINPDPVLPVTRGTPRSHKLALTWYTPEFKWCESIIVTYFVGKLFKERKKRHRKLSDKV